MINYLYKLSHGKELAQLEELIDVSLTKIIRFHRSHFFYWDDEDNYFFTDTEEWLERRKKMISYSEGIQREIAQQEAQHASNTFLTATKENYEELCNMITEIQPVIDEYASMSSTLNMNSYYFRIKTISGVFELGYLSNGCDCCKKLPTVPVRIKLKLDKYIEIFYTLVFYGSVLTIDEEEARSFVNDDVTFEKCSGGIE